MLNNLPKFQKFQNLPILAIYLYFELDTFYLILQLFESTMKQYPEIFLVFLIKYRS